MVADAGSFRDPAGRVVRRDGRVLRELSPAGVADYEAFAASALAGDPRVVATRRAGPTTLEHAVVPFWTYPYEWPFALLREAALLQLDLLDAAVGEGLSLKDATPYNVQWVDGRPLFVDVGSFERLRPGEPWAAYRQFCCLYLYPLMLTAYRGVPFQPLLRGALEGIEPADAARLLPRWRRGVPVNARLLARLERRAGEASGRETRGRLARAGYRPELIRAQARRLRRLVARLEAPAGSAWSAYARAAAPDGPAAAPGGPAAPGGRAAPGGPVAPGGPAAPDGPPAPDGGAARPRRGRRRRAPTPGYSAADLAAKHAVVRAAAERVRPGLAWDLGANDGAFARDVAPHAGLVVAMDADERALPAATGNLLPLVVDLCDPSPARGWALRERAALTDRGRPDLTLCLALVHHLAISRTVPAAEIVAWLAALGGTHVIEVPTAADPMVRRLLAAKAGDFPYDEAAFDAAIAAHFTVTRREDLATRVLYEATAS